MRTVELNQLAEVGFALTTRAVWFTLTAAAPQARGEQPTAERLARHLQSVIGSQMLSSEGRSETLVWLAGIMLLHQPQHSLAKLRGLSAVGASPHVAVHQRLRASFAVTFLHSLGLAIADLQQLRRFGQLQLPSFHSAQHFAAPQFLGIHPCPSQSRLLLMEPPIRGHFYWALKGTLSLGYNTSGQAGLVGSVQRVFGQSLLAAGCGAVPFGKHSCLSQGRRPRCDLRATAQ